MKFEKYRREILKNAEKNTNDESDNRIHFSDFLALYVAAFEVMVPILIIFFIVFSFCIFLLMKFWNR